jgi:HlyD family secretion protein
MAVRRFPVDASTSRSHRRRRRLRRAAFGLGVVVVVAAGAGMTVAAMSGREAAGFRTATVTTRDIDARLAAVATIEPVSQAAVTFPVAGTVATVDVTDGAQVTAGQTLASLDTTVLQAQVHTEQEALDQANLVVAKALDGEDVSSLVRAGGLGSSRLAGLLSTVVHPTFILVSDVGADDIAAAQQAVLSAQRADDTARDAAAAKLDSATSVCAAVGADVSPSDPAGATSTIQACQAALQDVVSAQHAVSDAQAALATAAAHLDDLLDQYAQQLQSTPTTTTPATTTPTTTVPTSPTSPTTTTPPPEGGTTTTTTPTTPSSTPGGPGGPGGSRAGGGGSFASGGGSGSRSSAGGASRLSGGGATVRSPSAKDLIAYQAAVDSATADLTAAQQQLAQATIVSPIDGTVVGVGLAAGDSVSAGSTTQQVVVQGAGGYEATASVGLTDVAKVKVGQAASLLPDGGTTAVSGHVVGISTLPDSTSSSTTTTYRVAVGLDGDTTALRNGALGSLSIVTGTASHVLAVPSSAVTSVGNRHFVDVVEGSTSTSTRVETGVVGDTWTEITGGLTAGQQVAVADLSEPLPSSATDASQATARAFQRTLGGFVPRGG